MRPFSSGGTYVNFLTQDADEERVRAAYGPELYDRLARVKAKYDPDNLFRATRTSGQHATADWLRHQPRTAEGGPGPALWVGKRSQQILRRTCSEWCQSGKGGIRGWQCLRRTWP
jgi:Berberine and berberine like